MKTASYILNVVLIAVIGFFAFKFLSDPNIATGVEDRTPVVLTAAEKAEVLHEMRGLLETVQSVIEAATGDDIAAIPDIVRPFGMAAVEKESVTMAAKLPVEVITMGYDAHRAMDALGAMAEEGASGDEILETLAGAMVLCTTCHNSYMFVAEEEIN